MIQVKSWPKDEPLRLSDGNSLSCKSCWVSLSEDGTLHLAPQTPLTIWWRGGGKQTIGHNQKARIWFDGSLHVEPVSWVPPVLSRAQGKALAYAPHSDEKVRAKSNFENLLHQILLTTPPDYLVSSDTVWLTWERLPADWERVAKGRAFAGPCMEQAARRGSSTLIRKVPSVAPWSHSGLPIGAYQSNIYDPKFIGQIPVEVQALTRT